MSVENQKYEPITLVFETERYIPTIFLTLILNI